MEDDLSGEPLQYLDPMTASGPFRRAAGRPQPNIVFISLDMIPPEFYSGTGPFRSAALERLQAEGLTFERACCSSPLCTPSRASYLTGRYSYITTNTERAHDGHEVHLREADRIFPEYLKAAGYQVRHAGKSHVGRHKFIDVFGENDAPWDRWSPPWFDDEAYLAFLRDRGLGRLGFDREIRGRAPGGRGAGNFYGGWIAPQNGAPFPQDATYPAFLVERAVRFLENLPGPDGPFYLQLDFFGPHQPFAIPGGLEARERELRRGLQLPASYRSLMANDFQALWREPRVYRMYRQNWGLRDPETLEDYIVANFLYFEHILERVSRLFDYLRAAGKYDNTWVFLIGDHGEMNGELGLIDKGAYLNPRVLHVPLVVKPAAGQEPAPVPGRASAPVSLLDIAPAMLEIAGVSDFERRDGVSLLRAAAGEPRPADKPILAEIWSHIVPNPAIAMVFRAANGREYLFTFNAVDDVNELYALGEGTGVENLYGQPDAEPVLDEAVQAMHAVLSGDVRWRSYLDAFRLEFAGRLPGLSGDRQLFL